MCNLTRRGFGPEAYFPKCKDQCWCPIRKFCRNHCSPGLRFGRCRICDSLTNRVWSWSLCLILHLWRSEKLLEIHRVRNTPCKPLFWNPERLMSIPFQGSHEVTTVSPKHIEYYYCPQILTKKNVYIIYIKSLHNNSCKIALFGH